MALRNVELSNKGAILVSLLTEGYHPGDEATKMELDAWTEAPPIAHTTVVDKTGSPDSFIAFYKADKEHYLIYELPSMKLVSHTINNVETALRILDTFLATSPADGG